jgi:hypothetical protein
VLSSYSCATAVTSNLSQLLQLSRRSVESSTTAVTQKEYTINTAMVALSLTSFIVIIIATTALRS